MRAMLVVVVVLVRGVVALPTHCGREVEDSSGRAQMGSMRHHELAPNGYVADDSSGSRHPNSGSSGARLEALALAVRDSKHWR